MKRGYQKYGLNIGNKCYRNYEVSEGHMSGGHFVYFVFCVDVVATYVQLFNHLKTH